MDEFEKINNEEIIDETISSSEETSEPEIIEENSDASSEVCYEYEEGSETEKEEIKETYVPNFSYAEPRPEKIKNKGLRVFCLALAGVMVITISLCAGYFAGLNKSGGKEKDVTSSLDLESRPDNDIGIAENYSEALSKVEKSIVNVLVYNETGSASGMASGVIYSKDGYIVTNDHIYEDIPNAKFLVRLYNGKEYNAKFIAGDVRSDLAVIKIQEDVNDLIPAKFGNSDEVVVGESVIAVGYSSSYGDDATLTAGIISAVNRRVTSTTTNYASSFLQTDATINPGNSGGGLCNMYGQVIGITSSKLAGENYDAVSYAIPTKTMKKVVESLLKNGHVDYRAKLGITYVELDSVSAKANGTPSGVYIASISEDSDLYGKGFGEGDVISHVNSKKILTKNILLDVIDNTNAGETITLTIYDKDKKTSKDVVVKLKADKGSSSYSTEKKPQSDENTQPNKDYDDNKIFDFPLD